ncbi:MAG: hypothetical protein GFH27_549289n77 [Chloroflexi bacterium AL-W]|nr:hypothetical protein [Chloroflexi bacterium AL-N1]NOK66809.1 hypothetical protein [Chloroflexi bacterium AL-N10]NOK74899.1 hypothetical protein [Chloroflexi bacterium AL-N5]NOK81412.1 hypothetical protein [Chloroflexi bacterium AL-W]NOK88881.1 hypothetical protein [Chloroflexi bacterium AL-N15]
MHYYCYEWDEPRVDAFCHWGASTYYVEVDSQGTVTRQLEVYANGLRLAYDESHPTDVYGMLSEKPVDAEIAQQLIPITQDTFEQEWHVIPSHNSDAQVIDVEADQNVTYTIEGQNCISFEGFIAEINAVLLKDYVWDGNLDAFNDLLYGGFGALDAGFHLEWRNARTASEHLGYAATIQWLRDRYTLCHPSNKSYVLQQSADAENQRGATLFDWLVQIIASHEGIRLTLR